MTTSAMPVNSIPPQTGQVDEPQRVESRRVHLVRVALLTLLVAFAALSTDLYLPSLPHLTRELNASLSQGQLTLSIFLIPFALCMLVYGPLSDRLGRKPLLTVGLVIYCVASVGCALAPTIEMLIIARFFQALGAAAGPVLARAVVRDVYGTDGAARLFSYMAGAMALAPATGPLLGGYIQEVLGWRANFWVLVGIAVFALIAMLVILKESLPEDVRSKNSLAGIPRIYASLLRHPVFRSYSLTAAGAYGAIFCWISGSSFILMDLVGLTPREFALCFACNVAGFMIGSIFAGRYTSRFGMVKMIRSGCLLSCAGAGTMLALTLAGSVTVVGLVGPMLVTMIGIALILPNCQAASLGPFPSIAGSASALGTGLQMGSGACAGVLLGIALEEGGGAPAMAGGIFLCVLFATVVFLFTRTGRGTV